MIFLYSFYINLMLNKIRITSAMKWLSSELLLKKNSNPEIAMQEIGRRLDKWPTKKAFCIGRFTSNRTGV